MIAQGMAWSKMVIAYSHQDGLSQGIQETFDGKHPCKICHEIARRHEPSSKSQALPVQLKFEIYALNGFSKALIPQNTCQTLLIRAPITFSRFSDPPLVPPPQEFLA